MTSKEYLIKQKFQVDLAIKNLENLVLANDKEDVDMLHDMIQSELSQIYSLAQGFITEKESNV